MKSNHRKNDKVGLLLNKTDVDADIFLAQETRPKKRLRLDNSQTKDKFNYSNDHFYEVAKDGGRHRVRQTFGQLVVEHSYPAQKLQLPFVRCNAAKRVEFY